jgi:hypothetical protein
MKQKMGTRSSTVVLWKKLKKVLWLDSELNALRLKRAKKGRTRRAHWWK